MAGGGRRPGAGRPTGGISQVRRILNDAIVKGMENAGREKGFQGDPEDVAMQTAAAIISDMILAGRGDEVLKVAVLAAPKLDADGDLGNGKDSPVLSALRRLPGLKVAQKSHNPQTIEQTTEQSTTYNDGATHPESEARQNADKDGLVFAPQSLLLDGRSEPGQAHALSPLPPTRGPTPPIYPDAGNFEKNENGADDLLADDVVYRKTGSGA